jgi:hypothetical protein
LLLVIFRPLRNNKEEKEIFFWGIVGSCSREQGFTVLFLPRGALFAWGMRLRNWFLFFIWSNIHQRELARSRTAFFLQVIGKGIFNLSFVSLRGKGPIRFSPLFPLFSESKLLEKKGLIPMKSST